MFKQNYHVILVPGLAYDAARFRIGYGGAYYDSFMVQHPNALKIELFYPFQKVDCVPREPHDARLEEVIIPKV